MGWQDAPVVEQPTAQQPAAQPVAVPSAAWMSAPAVKGGEFEPMIQEAAQKYNLPPELLRRQVQTESNFNPRAVSPKGAAGLMQLMPGTAKDLGVADPFDPAQSIDGGARYMSQMLKMFGGDYTKALSAYNRGPGNERKYGDKMRPKETQNYLKKIMGDFQESAAAQPKGESADGMVRKVTPQMGIDKSTGVAGDTTLAQDVARGAMGFNKGLFHDIPDASEQLVSAIIPDAAERFLDVEGKTGTERVAARQAAYDAERKRLGGEGIDLGRLGGNIVNPANLVLGAGPTTLLGAAGRGGAAGLMQPVEGTTVGDIASGKAKQVAAGAALGPLAEGAGRLITKGVGKGIGAFRGEMAGDSARIAELAKAEGVPLTAGDLLRGRKALGGIESTLENIRLPGVSLVGAREKTQAGAEAAAQRLSDDMYKGLQNMAYNNIPTIRKIAAGGGPRAAEAARVLKMADNAGTDEKAIMQASGNMAWLRKKLSADKLYTAVDDIAGDATIEPSNTLKAIDDSLTDLPKAIDADPSLGGLLGRWKTQLEGGAAPADDDAIADAVNFMEDAAPPAGEIVPNTLARMRQFHTSLQKRIDAATTDGTTDSGRLFLTKVAKAVNKDMEDFTSSNPELKDAAARAKGYYEQHVVPYQARTLAKALTSKDPDRIYGSFVKAQAEGKGDYAAKNLFKALDEKGRQAVRYGIVKQAMANAKDDGGGFSATKFADTINSTEYAQYFRNSAESARIKGLTELFGHINRSTPEHLAKSTAMLNGALGLGAGAGMLLDPSSITLAYGSAAFLRWLMTSEPGKRTLLSANVFGKAGSSKKMGELLEKATRQFGTSVGTAAGAEAGERGRVLP